MPCTRDADAGTSWAARWWPAIARVPAPAAHALRIDPCAPDCARSATCCSTVANSSCAALLRCARGDPARAALRIHYHAANDFAGARNAHSRSSAGLRTASSHAGRLFTRACRAATLRAANRPRRLAEFATASSNRASRRIPTFAVQSGRHEFDGQMPDWSRAALEADVAELQSQLAGLAKVRRGRTDARAAIRARVPRMGHRSGNLLAGERRRSRTAIRPGTSTGSILRCT